jgi:hypothetical protein
VRIKTVVRFLIGALMIGAAYKVALYGFGRFLAHRYVAVAVPAVAPVVVTNPPANPPNAERGAKSTTSNVQRATRDNGSVNALPIAQHALPSSEPMTERASSSASSVPPPNAIGSGIGAGEATQLMQSVIPQTPGIVTRVGNALAAIAGKAVTSGSPAVAGSPTAQGIPVVQNFQWERVVNGMLRLRWSPVGDGFRYTVYGGYAGPHPAFDTCFQPPRSGTAADWIPPKEGPKYYDLYVVAVDAKGHEGMPSQHLIIDLRNEP